MQFVDDAIFFSIASLKDPQSLKLILLVFRHLLGLRINLNKNTLFGININQDQTTRLAFLLDYVVFEWPLTYLDLPLGGKSKINFLLGSSVGWSL